MRCTHDVLKKLQSYTKYPDFIAYLSYILAHMPQEEDRIRTIAGYLLKNNCRSITRSSPEAAVFVKASVLQAFKESSHLIRNAAGQDIVALLGFLEPRNWPECLQFLVLMLDDPDESNQEVRTHLLFLRQRI